MKLEKNEEGDKGAHREEERGLVLEATRRVAIMTELHSNYASKVHHS
jgi:hypothetical protein